MNIPELAPAEVSLRRGGGLTRSGISAEPEVRHPLEVSPVLGVERENVHQRRRGDQGIRQPQARDLAAEHTRSISNPPIDRNLLHAGKEPAHLRLLLFGPGYQLGPGHDRIRQPTRLSGQSTCPDQMVDADVGINQ
jgi:hypothetical protein